MSEPFVGEIRMFAGNFAPRGWAFCDGQLLAVSQNDALFSLLGTIYGGDGRTTFGLPDIRGRLPIHAGSGPGLSSRKLGSKSGSEKETLTVNQLPSHRHAINATKVAAAANDPKDSLIGDSPAVDIFTESAPSLNLAATAITGVGGSRSHTNLMPALCIYFIIALFGIYPSRN